MSEIRMCDGCGTIFPLTQTGWEEYMRQTKAHHPHSSTPVVTGEVRMHMCPACASGEIVAVQPRLPLTGKELQNGG